MTQKQLARALDIAKNTVARQERAELGISKVNELAVKYLLVVESKKERNR
jgi:DNA-binding XRE family transcriptional regulator